MAAVRRRLNGNPGSLEISENRDLYTVNSGGISATQAAAGTSTAPANGAAIVTVAAGSLPAGTYQVLVKAGYGGTADVVNGMQLQAGATVISRLAMVSAVNTMGDHVFPRVTLDGSSALTVNAAQAGAVGSVYLAELIATRLSAASGIA